MDSMTFDDSSLTHIPTRRLQSCNLQRIQKAIFLGQIVQ